MTASDATNSYRIKANNQQIANFSCLQEDVSLCIDYISLKSSKVFLLNLCQEKDGRFNANLCKLPIGTRGCKYSEQKSNKHNEIKISWYLKSEFTDEYWKLKSDTNRSIANEQKYKNNCESPSKDKVKTNVSYEWVIHD